MSDIANQLAFVSACRQVERVKGLADLYIVPPVASFSVLEFGSFEELKKIGLTHGRVEVDKWLKTFDAGEGFKSAWFQNSNSSSVNPTSDVISSGSSHSRNNSSRNLLEKEDIEKK